MGQPPDIPDANPVDCLSDFLANTRYGAGMTVAQHPDDWPSVRSYCESQDIHVSPIIADRRRTVEHVEHLLSYFDGMLPYSQGQWRLRARRPETHTASLSDLDYVGDEMPAFGRMAGRETRNSLRLEYADRGDDYNRAVAEAGDDWSTDETGARAETITLPGITRPALARRWIQRALWSRLIQPVMASIRVGPRHTLLEPGDVVTMTHSEVDLLGMRMRVRAIAEAPESTFTVDLVEEPASILPWPTMPVQAGQFTALAPDRQAGPGDTLAVIAEWPSELPAQWSGVPVLAIGATGPSENWGGCNIHISRDGTSYVLAGSVRRRASLGFATGPTPEVPMMGLYDDARGQLTVDLSASFGSVSGVARADMLGTTQVAYLGGEWISFQDVTLVSSHTYALRGMLRGLYDSDTSSKPAGAAFLHVGLPQAAGGPTSPIALVPLTRADLGQRVFLKLPSFSTWGVAQDITSVQAITVTPRGVRLQPDPPSGLTEDNMPALDTTDQRTLTYVWRYRHESNVEDIEINSGVVLGRASDFAAYVVRLFTAAASAGPWAANTVSTVTSEQFTWTATTPGWVRADVTIRDTDGDESPIQRRVVRVI
jgi:hypothetical protein